VNSIFLSLEGLLLEIGGQEAKMPSWDFLCAFGDGSSLGNTYPKVRPLKRAFRRRDAENAEIFCEFGRESTQFLT
jgi:hypothetical protein